jgi:hypothetical protein
MTMTDLSDILAVDRIEATLSVANKKALFQQLGWRRLAGRGSRRAASPMR